MESTRLLLEVQINIHKLSVDILKYCSLLFSIPYIYEVMQTKYLLTGGGMYASYWLAG
jgi:hypothetical protein